MCVCTGCESALLCVCVCLPLYSNVYVNVRHVHAYSGAVMHPEYLQNFPGGQGKHSRSSRSPPRFEGVYVPLGQSRGTIVPKEKDAAEQRLTALFVV